MREEFGETWYKCFPIWELIVSKSCTLSGLWKSSKIKGESLLKRIETLKGFSAAFFSVCSQKFWMKNRGNLTLSLPFFFLWSSTTLAVPSEIYSESVKSVCSY